jgi:wobble nucleotide-excising tRNase
MISKIRHVRDYRAFKGWLWPVSLPAFRQVNLVYGINGTGKSTLTSLFQQAVADPAWSSGMEIDVIGSNGISRAVNTAGDAFWRDLCVFNKEYVTANLKFDEQAGSKAVPLLVLGERSVQAEVARERIQQRLAEIAEQLPLLQSEQKQKKAKCDSLATDRARVISQEVGAVGGRYEPRSYNATKVRQAIKDGIQASTTKVDLTKALSLARSPSKLELSELAATSFSIQDVTKLTQGVLAESAVSTALSDLKDPSHGHWAQEGIGLHDGRDICIFCANEISDERREALAAHFDTSLLILQEKIGRLERDLDERRTASKQAVSELPKSADLFEIHQTDYEAVVGEAELALKRFLASVDVLAAILKAKHASLFTSSSEEIKLGDMELSLVDVNTIIQQHNATAHDFGKERIAAATQVEKVRVAEIAGEYRELEAQCASYVEKAKEMKNEEAKLRGELGALDESNLDAQPLAKQLNDDLAHLLGRTDLNFEVEGQGYRITRDGTSAQHLSEGERNAISLLYFLRSLETHDTTSANCIIMIDDPVSSLDGNMLVGASTHLWTRLVGNGKCRQLFLFTHNFELFRMWSSHLEHYPKAREVKLTYGIYEMRMGARKANDDEYVRMPIIISWPDDPKVQARLRSEYHYLFWRVSNALRACVINPSAEGDVEAATVLPNVCRRLLEGFLGFKYPVLLGNLHAQITKASDGTVSEAMRARVLRFANAYSHNQEADTTMPVARPEAIEMLHVVLEFIKIIDQDHFDAMCEAVGVDNSFLIKDGHMKQPFTTLQGSGTV